MTLAMVGCWGPRPAAGEELRSIPELHFTTREVNRFLAGPIVSRSAWAPLLRTSPLPSKPTQRRQRLDVEPVLERLISLARQAGLPLRDSREDAGGNLIGVSASFNLSDRAPPVQFHLGERSVEPLGAFYSDDGDVSCAFSLPFRQFTFRLEGGDESEFGYYAIAGAEWHHATRPLAIGVGMPMQLRDAEGSIGGIIQLRMQLP